MITLNPVAPLKSDHFGIEISMCMIIRMITLTLKSDHFGMKIASYKISFIGDFSTPKTSLVKDSSIINL